MNDEPVIMLFVQAAYGCRFRYIGHEQIWIKLDLDDACGTMCGTICKYDPEFIKTKDWNGQQVCSFADSEAEMRTLKVEVIG